MPHRSLFLIRGTTKKQSFKILNKLGLQSTFTYNGGFMQCHCCCWCRYKKRTYQYKKRGNGIGTLSEGDILGTVSLCLSTQSTWLNDCTCNISKDIFYDAELLGNSLS